MKTTPNCNIYGYDCRELQKTYEAILDCSTEHRILTLSMDPLNDVAKNALRVSFEKLGYGNPDVACSFACLNGLSAPEQMVELVEGLDPLAVICADQISGKLMSTIYKINPLELYRVSSVRCRSVLYLGDLQNALGSDSGKQTIWSALKQLSRQ